jgi:protein arginine N-methyltransferase 1
VARKTITCPLHHSTFCLETGEQLAGPTCGALDVRVQPPAAATSNNEDKRMRYMAQQVWTPLSESLLGWDDAFHDLMLNDKLRMTAYRQAIQEVVRPGDRVIDLGTGTGILSLWALEAGAAQVIGIDMNAEILQLAVQRLQRAGHGNRFIPINRLSYDVELDQPVDVLISEIIGNLGDNENFQPILQDAIKRLLKPGGRVLPLEVSSYLTPVAAAEAHRDLCAGRINSLTPHYDVTQLYRQRGIQSPFNLYYDCILPPDLYLAEPQLLCRYAGQWEQPSTYRRELSYCLQSDGVLTGFKGCFIAQLSTHTVLDISGGDVAGGNTSDSWKHAFLPIETPITVRHGDRLNMTFSRGCLENDNTSFQQVYEWRGQIVRNSDIVGEFSQCTGG